MKKKPLILVIIPVFNEVETVHPLFQRLTAVFDCLVRELNLSDTG